MKKLFLSLTISLATVGCASVPRDEGMKEIADSVRARTQQSIEWQQAARGDNDPRITPMLAEPLSADQAVAVATLNSPRLQLLLAEAGIAQAELIEASTISNPVLELETRSGGPYRPYEVTLAQSLVELLQLPRRRALGRLSFEAAKLRLTSEVLSFASEVRDAYYDHLAAVQQLVEAQTALETSRTSTELALRQHAAGNLTDLDLENEQAMYEQAKLDLSRSEEKVVLTREALVRELGLRGAAPALQLVSDFPPLPSSEMSDSELDAMALTRRLDISVAQREVELARRAAPLRRMQALGEVVADIHLEREPEGRKTTGPGIAFPIPIFGRGRAARIRAAAELLRSEQTLAVVTANAQSEIRAARSRLSSARARVEYYRDVVLPRRARIVELTRQQQNAMLVGVFQLLQVRQNEANARRDYIEAQRDYWTARTDLDRALNGTDDLSFERTRGVERRATATASRGEH
jgi:cobalt-zinc-cadmium efflux system outer membrane protein